VIYKQTVSKGQHHHQRRKWEAIPGAAILMQRLETATSDRWLQWMESSLVKRFCFALLCFALAIVTRPEFPVPSSMAV
jgi:hypothetical protein